MTTASVADVALSIGIKRLHDLALEGLDSISDETLRWQANPGSPSILFHLWHMGRWADLLQALLVGQEQVWTRDNLAEAWGLTAAGVEADSTGMGLEDASPQALPLPPTPKLVDYVAQAFAAASRSVRTAVEAGRLSESCTDLYGRQTILVEPVAAHFGHLSRHLGMIEALLGVQGQGQG